MENIDKLLDLSVTAGAGPSTMFISSQNSTYNTSIQENKNIGNETARAFLLQKIYNYNYLYKKS